MGMKMEGERGEERREDAGGIGGMMLGIGGAGG